MLVGKILHTNTVPDSTNELFHIVEDSGEALESFIILAFQHDELAGGCILTGIAAPSVWRDSSENTWYLGSLVVARFAAGKGLGSQILASAVRAAKRRGKTHLRLDCWDGNDFLKTYYQKEGFSMLDAVQEKDYFCRLFERKVI